MVVPWAELGAEEKAKPQVLSSRPRGVESHGLQRVLCGGGLGSRVLAQHGQSW